MAAPTFYTAQMVRSLPEDGNRSPGDTFQVFEREHLIWHPAGVARPFLLPLEELFRPI